MRPHGCRLRPFLFACQLTIIDVLRGATRIDRSVAATSRPRGPYARRPVATRHASRNSPEPVHTIEGSSGSASSHSITVSIADVLSQHGSVTGTYVGLASSHSTRTGASAKRR